MHFRAILCIIMHFQAVFMHIYGAVVHNYTAGNHDCGKYNREYGSKRTSTANAVIILPECIFMHIRCIIMHKTAPVCINIHIVTMITVIYILYVYFWRISFYFPRDFGIKYILIVQYSHIYGLSYTCIYILMQAVHNYAFTAPGVLTSTTIAVMVPPGSGAVQERSEVLTRTVFTVLYIHTICIEP